MTDTGEGGRLRKRRRKDPYLQIDRRTIRDDRLSFRALGILTYLLDKPDNWVVRSTALAKNGRPGNNREGRDAVRSALRELARFGYYRLERRQMLTASGKYQFEMGNAISELPVEAWAAQFAAFAGKPVPVKQIEDGSFVVVMPDGSAVIDDFDEPDNDLDAGDQDEDQDGDLSALHEDPARSTSQPPATATAADPAPILPAPGPVRGDGRGGVLRAGDVQPTLDAQLPDVRAATNKEIAQDIAQAWLAYLGEQDTKIVWRAKASSPIHAVRSLVEPALSSGYTEHEIKWALTLCLERDATTVPSTQQLDRMLQRVRKDRWRPGQQGTGKGAVSRQNDVRHVDDLTPAERAARNPLTLATRSSDVAASAGAGTSS